MHTSAKYAIDPFDPENMSRVGCPGSDSFCFVVFLALVSLFDLTGGRYWTRNDGWDPAEGSDPCDMATRWHGVGCIDPCDYYRDGELHFTLSVACQWTATQLKRFYTQIFCVLSCSFLRFDF